MKRRFAALAVALAGCSHGGTHVDDSAAGAPPAATAPVATPTANPTVGGATMLTTRTIAENAAAAPTLTMLVGAIKAADLTATLSGPGPYTVFAPTNAAFGRLAPGTFDTLLKPENRASLTKLLTYHVVPGALTAAELMRRVTAGGGTATLTTVEGDPLTVTMQSGVIALTDVNGNHSYVETADVRQANGMVHVINGVLVPKLS